MAEREEMCAALDEAVEELKAKLVAMRRRLAEDRCVYPFHWQRAMPLLRALDTAARLRERICSGQ